MNHLRHRAKALLLCLCLVSWAGACSDEPDNTGTNLADAGTDLTDAGTDVADAATDLADAGTTSPDADTQPATGLILRGELVPTGGMSMSQRFTLSGHLSPGLPAQKSASASYQLELSPAQAETDN